MLLQRHISHSAMLHAATFAFLDAMTSAPSVDASHLGFQVHVDTTQILNLRHQKSNAFFALQELTFLCTNIMSSNNVTVNFILLAIGSSPPAVPQRYSHNFRDRNTEFLEGKLTSADHTVVLCELRCSRT